MGKIAYKYRVIDNWRIGENESWLTDMAAEGLHLHKLGVWFAHFERGEARQMRYRVELAEDIKPEQVHLYSEAGWEYVCGLDGLRGIQVFRSPEELNAPELHTDPAEQAIAIRQMKRKIVREGIFWVFAIIFLYFMLGFTLFMGRTPTLSLVEYGDVTVPFLLIFNTYACIKGIKAAFAVNRLSRDLREGRPINHRANWRPYQRRGQIARLLLMLFTVFVCCAPFVQIRYRPMETLPPPHNEQMLLRLADIEQNPLLERQPPNMIDGVDWGNSIQYKWSPYAKTILSVFEKGVITGRNWTHGRGEYKPSLTYDLYRLRFPVLVDGLVDDLCVWYGFHGDLPVVEETGYPGFDRLFVREEGISKEVFASKGSTVIYLRYDGEQPLEQVIELTEQWLARL